MQIKESSSVYDAIIVGSGAGGGMSAKVLADAGLKIAIVEAGPFFDPADPDNRLSSNGHMNHHEEEQVLSEPLANLIWRMVVGK